MTDVKEQVSSLSEKPKAMRTKKLEKTPTELHREYLDMDTDEEEFGRQG